MPAGWFSRTRWAVSVVAVQNAHCPGTGRRQACSLRPCSCHMPSSPPTWPHWARSNRRAGSKTARTHARRTCSWSRCTRAHCASFTEDHVSAAGHAAPSIHSPPQPCDTGSNSIHQTVLLSQSGILFFRPSYRAAFRLNAWPDPNRSLWVDLTLNSLVSLIKAV